MTLFLSVIFTVVFLTGCADGSTNAPVDEKDNVTQTEEGIESVITVVISKDHEAETLNEKEIEITDGDLLLDVMKANFDVEEENGFIYSIDGVAPKEGEEKSWMYFVNGEMAMVGAAEYELTANDRVQFDLQPWE